MYFEAGR